MKKIAIYLLIVIVLAFALQWFLQEGLRRNTHGVYNKYTTLFLKQNSYNALILGSSRAEMHTDVDLLDSLTGLHTFNAGVSGASTKMAFIVLKSYLLKSNAPNTIFFECDFHISHLKTDTIFNFPRYFPYLSNPILYSNYIKMDHRFFQFKYNPFYCLPFMGINSISPSLHGWLGKSTTHDMYYTNGFFKNMIIDNYDHFYTKTFNGYVNMESRNYLDSIITECNSHKIRLIFTMSPAYKDAQKEVINKKQIVEQYKNIAFINHIPFFDYSEYPAISNHKLYFEDNYHMLYSGARIYTQKIADDFNNIPR